MSDLPQCPKCGSTYTYEDRDVYVCPECAHEWPQNGGPESAETDEKFIKDSNGNVLTDGDTVTVIKDLKVKGSSAVVKVGPKVKNIRLGDVVQVSDVKITGIGAMNWRPGLVRKVC